MSRPRRLLAALVVLPTALSATLLTTPDQASGQAVSSIDARWEDAGDAAAPGQALRALVDVAAQPDGTGSEVRVTLDGAQVRGIPAGCTSSSTTDRLSWISADARTLVCRLDPAAPGAQLAVTAVVTATSGGTVSGTAAAGSVSTALPVRTVPAEPAGAAADPRLLRLVSSPDFLNADVGDLRRGPGSWTHRASSNTTNTSYQTSLDHVLDDWQSLDPDAVLVAGDLVNGHWDRDSARTRTFGPTRTDAQKRSAIRRAARTYYPQWLQRFTSRGLDVHPAIGDHEVGDNPFDAAKRRLAPAFKQQFAREFTRTASGRRYADHPRGPASGTAYAFRPVPQVQVVSIDVFDITRRRARVDVDHQQMQWLRRVLARAQADGVTWTIVQGHVPILEPVRTRGSSGLHVRGAERSALWRTFARYGVDLYLAGEVHDVTMSEAGGVTQLTHGGLFQFGLTNYALIDAHADHLDIDLRDYTTVVRRHGRRLWQTRLPGIPRTVEVAAEPFTIGTARLAASGGITERTGILLPWQRGR